MKCFYIIFIAVFAFSSCQKKYTYVEEVRETSVFGGSSVKDRDEKIITASSDTAAYLEAYQKFCISKKVYQDMLVSGMKDPTVPLRFKLYDEQGNDISDIQFATRTVKEQEINDIILGMGNVVKRTDNSEEGLGDWEISNYVDEFQEKTEEKYIKQTTLGNFSNSATTNSSLLAHILIDKDNVRLRLQEYAKNYVKDDESIRFRVRSNDSIDSEFRMWIDRDGYIGFLSYDKKEKDSLLHILLRGGEVKFFGVVDHYGKSTYRFSFNADKLQNAIDEMNKKEEPKDE